ITCTCLFYFGMRMMHAEYEQYHRYDPPEGDAVKVFHSEKKLIGALKRIFSIRRIRDMEKLVSELEDFFHFLQIEKGLSENTLTSYRRDLRQYIQYIKTNTHHSNWNDVKRNDIITFLYH